MNDLPNPDDDTTPTEKMRGPAKPVGLKLVLASILLLAYLGYLVYVGFSDPR
ncbi:MAG: hypothetical protein QF609_12900 [Gammaproteobacteria bacterium]|jgi:hypothetical protein|nr:hypothetical protein [Gammaproteobacteria bacterium]